MANFTDPIKTAFGRYMGDYYGKLIADTPSLQEFAGRGLAKSIVWAPGRMIDQVNDMITAWRRNDTSTADQPTTFVPVMIAAMSKDYVPAPVDHMVPLANPVSVMLPDDPKQRVFEMRVVTAQIRTQVVIIATEESTARSLAMQLHVFACAAENRRFFSSYPLAGISETWPVSLETPDLSAINSPDEAKNLTILALDLTMLATVPLLSYPKGAEPNDGKGAGTVDDPNGYLVVVRADGTAAPNSTATPTTWTVGGP